MVVFSMLNTKNYWFTCTQTKTYRHYITTYKNISVCVTLFILLSGISVGVTLGIRMLSVSVSLTDDLKTLPKGLLGNFDGNATNDFVLPDGTILSNNMTDREIFTGFGEKCE